MKRALVAAVLACLIAVGVAAASGPTLTNPASIHKTAPATFKVKFVTTKGSYVITVTRKWAPIGADRFYSLVYYHYYDNEPLFRVDPGFVVQWGINMTPAIAKPWQSATIADDPEIKNNYKGTVTFAVNGPHSRTTQIFVNLVGHGTSLGKLFAPFGVVTSGFPVFKALYSGYGEGPSYNQSSLVKYGAWWVKKYYPKLDWIKTARIVP